MSYTFNFYTREKVFARAGYRCACQCEKCLGNEQLEVHHKIANTAVNRKVYGEWLQSAENAVVLCGYCHVNCKHKFKKEGEDEA